MSKNLKALVAVAALCASGSALADTVNMDFSVAAQYGQATAPTAAAHLTISDVSAGTVEFILTTSLTGSQTLTGLWLDAPGLSGVSVAGSPAATPAAVTLGSYSATANIVPAGNQALTGAYNLWLKLPNNATGLQGTTTETFYLTGSGLSASLFNTLAAQKSGKPDPDFVGVMGLTNAYGTGGSGVAYFGATAPVPLPAALPLLVGGLGGMGGFLRRRRPA